VRHATGQEFVKQHSQGVDVATGVDVEVVQLRLLRAHVLQRADQGADLGIDAVLAQPLTGRLGDAEVDHLRHRLAVVEGDEHVGRFQVPVDDSFLVRVLHRLADRDEQLEARPRGEFGGVAVVGDGHALDELHDEVGLALLGGAGVEDLGDAGVVHAGQSLALLLEAGDQSGGVEAQADHLEGDAALHGLVLVSDPDLAHAADAQALAELEAAGQHVAGSQRTGLRGDGRTSGEDAGGLLVGGQQALQPLPQPVITAARLVQKRPPLGRVRLLQGGREQRFLIHALAPRAFDGNHHCPRRAATRLDTSRASKQ
jgi:hypothetical protein